MHFRQYAARCEQAGRQVGFVARGGVCVCTYPVSSMYPLECCRPLHMFRALQSVARPRLLGALRILPTGVESLLGRMARPRLCQVRANESPLPGSSAPHSLTACCPTLLAPAGRALVSGQWAPSQHTAWDTAKWASPSQCIALHLHCSASCTSLGRWVLTEERGNRAGGAWLARLDDPLPPLRLRTIACSKRVSQQRQDVGEEAAE